MKPFIKWVGGKTSELQIILNNLPEFKNYYEPFIGGGAVYLAVPSTTDTKFYINDLSTDLTNLYSAVKSEPEFIRTLKILEEIWTVHLPNLYEENKDKLIRDYSLFYNDSCLDTKERLETLKVDIPWLKHPEELQPFIVDFLLHRFERFKAMQVIEYESIDRMILTAIKGGFYYYIRNAYNQNKSILGTKFDRTAMFWFIREFCFSGQDRVNKAGECNVAYGGNSYNNKSMAKKIALMESPELKARLNNTTITNLDFLEALKNVTENDFIFLDPPYDSGFSKYDGNIFSKDDHIRLANFCKQTKAKFMMVIKYTDFIFDLYKDFKIISYDKRYQVNLNNCNYKDNDRYVVHLMITNY